MGSRLKKPDWLKIKPPSTQKFVKIKQLLKDFSLCTVCTEAHCPNQSECWSQGHATFMILGDICTRSCGFCAVKSGDPGGKVDLEEPDRLAEAVKALDLRYIVLTSVTRDDLPDGGALHFARCVRTLRKVAPSCKVEVLIPDFNGNLEALNKVVKAKPDVISHNVETVARLQSLVRDSRASYSKSFLVLKKMKNLDPSIITKSSLMLGLGEREEEVIQTMRDLRSVFVDVLTLGQYLQPSPRHVEVKEYVHPEVFDRYKEIGLSLGFIYVVSGPFVRTSYQAGELFSKNI
ncbi:MAG: lipoyl synthase [Candidatus Hodarchaeota archaeon]